MGSLSLIDPLLLTSLVYTQPLRRIIAEERVGPETTVRPGLRPRRSVQMASRSTTELEEKIPRVGDITTFKFKKPDGYRFAAGQWTSITIPGPEKPLGHHFTLSSSPTEHHLAITTRLRGTEFKNALDALSPGTEVEMEGPYGSFTLTDERVAMDPESPLPARALAFITGGIGITAPRSILRYLADSIAVARSGPARPPAFVGAPIRLLYANHSETEIAFADELEEMRLVLRQLTVVHVLSQPSPAWTGITGHIDADLICRELGDLSTWLYFLSGPPSLVASLRDALLSVGVADADIKAERYMGYE
jgi:glycine betaine catabolism B